MNLLKNLDDNEEHNKIKIKIMLFYLMLFKGNRRIKNMDIELIKDVIHCLESKPITSKILENKNLTIYKNEQSELLTNEEFEKLTLEDSVYIKLDDEIIKSKIKYFNNEIENLSRLDLEIIFEKKNIKFLNIDGLLNNNEIKIDKRIEEECKNMLFKKISSNICKKYFEDNDIRFKNEKKKPILNYIFQCKLSKEIFEEIWNNILFIPFPKDKTTGYNIRYLYTIYIKNSFLNKKSPLTIISIIDSYLNDIFHEIFHTISLLYGAITKIKNIDTPSKYDNNLVEMQNKYKKKFNLQGISIIKNFTDFGDLMEVNFYGIKKISYKTFSSLFEFNNNIYESADEYRENYLYYFNLNYEFKKNEILDLLYNDEDEKIIYNIELDENGNELLTQNENENKIEKNKIRSQIRELFNLKIMQILLEIFPLEDKEKIKNKLYYRERSDGGNDLIYNSEYYHKCICHVVRRNRKKNFNK